MNIDLSTVRQNIDEIDEQLIRLLAKRFEITHQVGLYKKEHNVPPVDPEREARQLARIEKLAQDAGLSPDFAKAILRLVIDETVANHKRLREQSS